MHVAVEATMDVCGKAAERRISMHAKAAKHKLRAASPLWILYEARSKLVGYRICAEGHNAFFQDIANSILFTLYALSILFIVSRLALYGCKIFIPPNKTEPLCDNRL